jgi:hypothetical protein
MPAGTGSFISGIHRLSTVVIPERVKRIGSAYYPGIILLLASLIIGLSCYKDYGVSWDETIQRDIGLTSYNYIVNNDQTLSGYQFRNMGTGFELPLIFVEKVLRLHDTRDIFFMRHLVTHLFFLLGCFCCYLLSLRLFRSQLIAALGYILLAFDPRIFGHSFYNSKDIPFLSAFVIVFLVCHIAFEKNKPAWYLLLGLACGYVTSIRAMGILLLPSIGVFFLFDLIKSLYDKQSVIPAVRNGLLFITGFALMTYIAWPVLWSNPVDSFKEQFISLANIHYEGESLFAGTFYKGNSLPWNYMPVWFSITTPELWLIAGISGYLLITLSFIRKPLQFLVNNPERNYLLYIACFTMPVLAMTLLHGVNVDDWRHLYFIYPSFVLLALYALSKLVSGRKKIVLITVSVPQMAMLASFIIKYHPYEQLYFNNLVSHEPEYLRHNYDMDYWGTAYKDGLEYILAHDDRPVIRVYCWVGPILGNIDILEKAARKRIVVVHADEQPDYFITNFRNHPQEYDYPHNFYELKVLNSTIFRTYKLN